MTISRTTHGPIVIFTLVCGVKVRFLADCIIFNYSDDSTKSDGLSLAKGIKKSLLKLYPDCNWIIVHAAGSKFDGQYFVCNIDKWLTKEIGFRFHIFGKDPPPYYY